MREGVRKGERGEGGKQGGNGQVCFAEVKNEIYFQIKEQEKIHRRTHPGPIRYHH